MRFSVRSHTQNVLFRETAPRLPSSGKAHSTERRILCRHPHGKAHPRPATSQKSALWTRSVPRRDPSLTEKRTLRSTLSASPCRTLRSTLSASPCRTLRAAPCGSHATRRYPALYSGCTAIWVITPSTHPGRDTRLQLGTQTITRLDGILSRRLGPLDRITSRRAYSMARPCSGLL